MNYPDRIKTVKEFKESKYKEKKSLFIAQIYPISTNPEADNILKTTKKKFHDATHHCFAYKLADGTTKSSDAGEPSGTAGLRILSTIEHYDPHNIIIIVIRYFGGIKLGTGALGRAYYNAAFSVAEKSEIVTKKLYRKVQIVSDIERVSMIHNILSTYKSKIETTNYDKRADFTAYIPVSKSNTLKVELTNQSKGKVKYLVLDDYIYL